jgi:hypothetical protein
MVPQIFKQKISSSALKMKWRREEVIEKIWWGLLHLHGV